MLKPLKRESCGACGAATLRYDPFAEENAAKAKKDKAREEAKGAVPAPQLAPALAP